MKRLFLCILALIFTLSFTSLGVSALRLSYATDAIAASEITLLKGGVTGQTVTFTDGDFRQALGVTTYPDITILSLPDAKEGVLKVDGLRITRGQVVRRTQIPRLEFTPSNDLVKEATFTFQAGNLSGGAPLTCVIRFSDKANDAPTAVGSAAQCITLKKNVSVFGTLYGYDPDGDDLTYLIIAYPKKGNLKILDASTGEFSYTPHSRFTGEDSFSYVVRDTYGNYSSLSTVTLKVGKGTTEIDVGDLDALAYFTQRNVLNTKNKYDLITREAFVVALLKTYGYLSPDGTTFYDDSDRITPSAVPYLALATELGVLYGEYEGGELLAKPDAPITYQEACEMVYKLCPHISLPAGTFTHLTPYLTYGEAARLLYEMVTE